MSDAVLQATIRAFDQFSQQFQKYQAELKKTGQAQQQSIQSTQQLNRAHSDFLGTIGQVGALYAFQRGLREVMSTGREFQLAIKQSQAVVGDFSSTLRDSAMASRGIQGPTEIAKAYYELGSAGLNAQQVIEATPDVLDFATAGLIKMDDAAYAVTSTVKSFGLEWSQTTDVVDAFTQAMNSTALKAEDFTWAMSSAGAVGKMAGQDFKEVIAAVAAMRDAGVQAQDAGTSVKAALLQLINPTKEAKDLMDALGISVYDSSGKMLQWHQIIANLEKVLAPYNEQSRNLILTTIAGSDGVRALATGLNMGSQKLAEYVNQMASADGATKAMAATMTDSFDGAIRKANANLERAKVLLFEDLEKGSVGLLGAINGLVTGFNSLDEGGRRIIETIVGGAGLVVALTLLANVASKAGLALKAMWVEAGPAGWIILGISALAAGVMGYAQAQQQATEAQQKANEKLADYNKLIREGVPKEKIDSTKEEISKIQDLIKEYDNLSATKERSEGGAVLPSGDNLSGKTSEYLEAEEALDKVNAALAEYGLTADTARKMVEQLNQRVAEATALDYQSVVAQTNKAVKTKQTTDATTALIQEYLKLTTNVKNETDVTNLSASQKSRLSVVVGQLAEKYPSMVTALDKHQKAMLMDNRGMNEQMSVMKALAFIETQEAKARIEAEQAKTKVVLDQTRERLSVLLKEQKALRDASSGHSTPEQKILRVVAGGEFVMSNMDKALSDQRTQEMKRKQAEYTEEEKAYGIYAEALKNLGSGKITAIPGETAPGTRTFDIPTNKKGNNEAADAAKKQIQEITDYLYTYKAATDAAANAVQGLSGHEQFLAQKMESGQGDINTAIELEKVRTAQLTALSYQQEKLHQQAEAERQKLIEVAAAKEAASDPDVIRDLRGEMDNLNNSIAQLGQQYWQVEQQKLNLTVLLKKEEQKKYDDAYQQAMDLMQHQVNMARMSTEQQIEYMTKLYDWMKQNKDAFTGQQLAEAENDLYRLRKQQLQAYLDSLEDEYQDKLDAIDARTEATTKAIQDQIDALEDEGTGSDRAEATRKHNEKLQQLEEQRRYHELRTGVEHQKAIADIDKQMAEENIEFQRQQEEWLREDQQDALQEQLDDAQEAGDEERKRLEDHYRRVIEIANQGALDTLAALAAKDPDWLETGKRWIQNLIDGIDEMEPEFQDRIDEAMDQMGDYEDRLPHTSTEPDLPSSGGGSSGGSGSSDEEDPSSMTWQQLLEYYKKHRAAAEAELERTGKVYTQKLRLSDIEGAGAAHHWANQIREAIGQSATYDENTASSSYHGYAKGGPILYDQIAQVHAGEYVIPANLVDAIRRGTVPPAQAGPGVSGGGVTININAPLLAPENIHLYNNLDIEQVGDGLRKEIMALAAAKG